WPDKYANGGARWVGRLYARGSRTAFSRSRVRYGTWGSALFQSLYSPGGGAMSSLLVAPEWHLWIAALALVSIAGVAWTPLLLALPLLAATLGITLLAAAASAAQARSVLRPVARNVRLRRWAFTTLLHLVQPLARTRGRL